MRLLNVHDLTLRKFIGVNIPKYVITSHRWSEDEEASMKDLSDALDMSKSGHRKVKGFADYVRKNVDGVEWIWIDTCCINQDSSQEVSEAINSMFRWYLEAQVCLAYMADVSDASDMASFGRSVWFTRGWYRNVSPETLQELLAPKLVVFLSCNWKVIGRKGVYSSGNTPVTLHSGKWLTPEVATITGIPQTVLDDWTSRQHFSANARLQWSKGRETTSEEDTVYCLLGIFGVAMPVIYGEGQLNAQKRLREAVRANGEHLDSIEGPPITKSISAIQGGDSTVVIRGHSGAGKSQLVRRYIDAHEEEYSTILWIDASTQATLRASFVRCCRALAITFGSSAGWDAIKDAFEVQALLRWLHNQPKEYRWLLVVDGADDFAWNVQETIPLRRSLNGVVVVTTRSHKAIHKIHGDVDVISVPDTISTEEGVSLLCQHSGLQADDLSKDCKLAAERIVRRLKKDLFSVDLAGAHIAVSAEYEPELDRYL
ncbi:hypothetical protein PRZ48_009114 [Zasmidium cellare]|uniref:Uncharacterized protein n=1 Tax=Zasmidium cellare TaxID=395010 RepID=A0ABR0EHG8_ZASCE|nr:hypothetical protein PRZ48_009114 [Zasmidium cellare]